jgi:alginate O-acetyltransferase complex protein AlgI
LYYFLPAVLILYFLAPMRGGSPRWRNWVLLLASLLFYAFGEPVYVLLMIGQILSGWGFGLLIERWRGKPAARWALIGSLVVGLGGLMFFKYTDFFLANISALGLSVGALGLIMPIGISFYTFQILSYDIDLYRGRTAVQRNPATFATYVSLFPQLIAGPIVRYADVAAELEHRRHSVEDVAAGARRLVIGLGKQVLVANVLGELVNLCRDGDGSVLSAWLYIVAYALHIYFDFSGYSDMAIGMGRMFGFRFLENFNYPYVAKSVTEFWRRWHISLSSWFRDYVYIPLGGNRVGPGRHIFNILVVWFLTGFWHGAGWNFIAWGLYFAALLLLEKFLLGGLLAKLPSGVSRLYLVLCVLLGWIFFDATSMGQATAHLGLLFGNGGGGLVGPDALYYLRSYLTPLLIAAVGCTPLPKTLAARLAGKAAGRRALTVLEPLFVAVLLLLITAYLVDGSFNPFIYFRF